MRTQNTRPAATLLIVAAAIALLAGCGPSNVSEGRTPAPARTEHIGPNVSVVLTPLGLQRIGVQTATATAAGSQTIIPVGALLYEPNGQAAVYTKTTELIYTIQNITVATINGNSVVVSHGLTPGTVVVTQGAEELLGVQNGIGIET